MFNATEYGELTLRETNLERAVTQAGQHVAEALDALWKAHDRFMEATLHLAGYCLISEADTMPSGPGEMHFCLLCAQRALAADEFEEAERLARKYAFMRANRLKDLENAKKNLANVRAELHRMQEEAEGE